MEGNQELKVVKGKHNPAKKGVWPGIGKEYQSLYHPDEPKCETPTGDDRVFSCDLSDTKKNATNSVMKISIPILIAPMNRVTSRAGAGWVHVALHLPKKITVHLVIMLVL